MTLDRMEKINSSPSPEELRELKFQAEGLIAQDVAQTVSDGVITTERFKEFAENKSRTDLNIFDFLALENSAIYIIIMDGAAQLKIQGKEDLLKEFIKTWEALGWKFNEDELTVTVGQELKTRENIEKRNTVLGTVQSEEVEWEDAD